MHFLRSVLYCTPCVYQCIIIMLVFNGETWAQVLRMLAAESVCVARISMFSLFALFQLLCIGHNKDIEIWKCLCDCCFDCGLTTCQSGTQPGPWFKIKTVFPAIGMSIIKIRQSLYTIRSVYIFSWDQAALWMVLFINQSVWPSVCLSVCRTFSLCSYHHIIMKFSGVITINGSDVPAKGQGQRSKVKVKEVKTKLCPKLKGAQKRCPIVFQGNL